MKLTKTTVSLDHLLIDPNNPRFADISCKIRPVSNTKSGVDRTPNPM